MITEDLIKELGFNVDLKVGYGKRGIAEYCTERKYMGYVMGWWIIEFPNFCLLKGKNSFERPNRVKAAGSFYLAHFNGRNSNLSQQICYR